MIMCNPFPHCAQYIRVGLSTRMRWRIAGSGQISVNRSTSSPSLGMSLVMFGAASPCPRECAAHPPDQARANGTASRNGRLPTDTRSEPQTLIHASGCCRRDPAIAERDVARAVGRLDAPHMVDDEGHVDSAQKIGLRHDVLGVEMQHDMPSIGLIRAIKR